MNYPSFIRRVGTVFKRISDRWMIQEGWSRLHHPNYPSLILKVGTDLRGIKVG